MPYRFRPFLTILLLFGGAFFASCRPLETSQSGRSGGTELLKASLPPDAVTVDLLVIHVPHQDRELLERLWDDVDEQELSPEIRDELALGGFRAGLLGATIPESLSRLVALKGHGLRQNVEQEYRPRSDETAALTLSKTQTLIPGNRFHLPIGESTIPKIPVLAKENGRLTGKTYYNAAPTLAISAKPVPDGSVDVEVTPFLGLGEEVVTKYKYGQMVTAYEQATKTFENLRFTLPLRPGQFLVIGPANRKTGGLGHYFFTEGIGDFDQKIVVLRLLFTQHDQRFHQFPGFQEILDSLPADKSPRPEETPESAEKIPETAGGESESDEKSENGTGLAGFFSLQKEEKAEKRAK